MPDGSVVPVQKSREIRMGSPEGQKSRLNLDAISRLSVMADFAFAFAIRAVGAIGVADHLRDGPQDIATLATETGCNEDALLRVMRALVSKSVFSEGPTGTFALEPIGDLLRSDHPLSMRWFFRTDPDAQAMAGLEYSIRTGQPAFDHIFGMDYFDWLAAYPVPLERFRQSQSALNRLEFLAITRSYPWREVRTIVDIGGNDGSLLKALLQKNPELSGTVFDLPGTAEKAHSVFEPAGISDRTTVVSGNIFEGNVPSGADLYIMKRILVGFSDEQTVQALSNVRRAMTPHSRLLIMEPAPDGADQVGLSLDLLMVVLGLGRVRNREQFEALLTAAGLASQRRINAGLLTIIESRIAGE